MQPYTDTELESLLADLESDLVERKESWSGDAPEKGRQAVCAFANDLPGHGRAGVLFVGARENGTPSGVPITDQLLTTLADVKTDGKTVPPPSLIVEKRRLRGAEMAVVTVAPCDSPPARYAGRIWIRVGPRRAIASAQDERILNERRRHRDQPFDVRPLPSARLSDLDQRRFEDEYLPSAVAREVLEANERTLEQRLAATKMIASADDPTPTVLGLLVLGIRTRDFLPGAYIQFLRIAGTGLGDPIVDSQDIDGAVGDVLKRMHEKLVSHNRVAVDLTSGMLEKRTTTYPLDALDQLVRNAVLHRTYEHTNAPVKVHWFDDRVEIINPGGPFGSVTSANFGAPGVTDYRNPNLAEALKVLHFVQHFGMGIPTARSALAKNGNPPPEFEAHPSHVAVIVRSAAP
jgi:ATP-dependent DNA helicase RecG